MLEKFGVIKQYSLSTLGKVSFHKRGQVIALDTHWVSTALRLSTIGSSA
jgi:hypothetical protein